MISEKLKEQILDSVGKAFSKPRDVKRIPRILKKLGQLWKLCPDLRFLQLMCNFSQKYYGYTCIDGDTYLNDTFHVEDDKFEQLIDKEIKNAKRLKKRKS